ncbi:hypothetical protein E6W17_30940 [Streptomyces sp. A1547]|nr:hypothetical protein E6W17_30940 [Streptomyces sp. A1547]
MASGARPGRSLIPKNARNAPVRPFVAVRGRFCYWAVPASKRARKTPTTATRAAREGRGQRPRYVKWLQKTPAAAPDWLRREAAAA